MEGIHRVHARSTFCAICTGRPLVVRLLRTTIAIRRSRTRGIFCTFRDFLILERSKTPEKGGQSGNNGCFRRPLIPSRNWKKPEKPAKNRFLQCKKIAESADIAMAINALTEKLRSFAEAARRLPALRVGKPVNPSTVWRWTTRGVRARNGIPVRCLPL